MAMTKCKECDKEISTEADRCPHCGAKPKKPAGWIGWTVAIFVVLIIFASVDRDNTTSSTSAKPSFPTDAATQQKRQALLQKLIAQRVFYKIEVPGSLPHVYVDTNWYQASIDQKEAFASVVYAYYYTISPSADIVVFKDKHTGNRIGTFSTTGLDLKN